MPVGWKRSPETLESTEWLIFYYGPSDRSPGSWQAAQQGPGHRGTLASRYTGAHDKEPFTNESLISTGLNGLTPSLDLFWVTAYSVNQIIPPFFNNGWFGAHWLPSWKAGLSLKYQLVVTAGSVRVLSWGDPGAAESHRPKAIPFGSDLPWMSPVS